MGNVHQLPDDDSRCAGKDVKYLSLSIRARSRLATKVYLTLRMQMRSRNFSRMTTWSGFVQAASAFMFRAIWVHREAGCAPCFTRKSSKRSEEHTSELQSRLHLVCRLLLEKKKNDISSVAVPQRIFLINLYTATTYLVTR